MSLLRVGIDVRCLSDSAEVRGFARYTSEVLHALAARNDVELLGYSDRDVEHLPPRMQFRRFSSRREIDAEQRVWPRLLRDDAIDVVFSPANRGLPLLTSCPTVLTLHDAVEWDRTLVEAPQGRDRFRFGYSNIASILNAGLVITVSRHSARDIEQRLGIPGSRMRVVYEAADDRFRRDELLNDEERRLDRAVAEKLGIDSRTVVYVGGCDAKKGIPELVEGFAAFAAKTSDASLALVGARPAREAIEALAASLGIVDRVHLLGYVPDAELPSVYRNAGCFATAAAFEGFGLPAMEAMACGTPVIVPSAGSLPEVVAEGGLHYAAGNASDLGRALREVMGTATSQRLWAGKAIVRAGEFSWARTADLTLQVLREAAAIGRVRRVGRAVSLVPQTLKWVA